MRCPECGRDVLVPSERRITIDRGQVFDVPVPAVECPDCGKMFADEVAREQLERMRNAPTWPPDPSHPDDPQAGASPSFALGPPAGLVPEAIIDRVGR
jgi:hypothetical protein